MKMAVSNLYRSGWFACFGRWAYCENLIEQPSLCQHPAGRHEKRIIDLEPCNRGSPAWSRRRRSWLVAQVRNCCFQAFQGERCLMLLECALLGELAKRQEFSMFLGTQLLLVLTQVERKR
jgi:hypothetical protein